MIILASKSIIRANLLKNAGVDVVVDAAEIDERMVETVFLKNDMIAGDIARILAQAKAQDVSRRYPGEIIIGADQTLEIFLNNEPTQLYKPADRADAQRQLLLLQGKTHSLHSSVCCVKDGAVIFDYVDRADMTMRSLEPEEIGRYLAHMGDEVLTSIGCYQLEGFGVRLFEKIEGNFHTILGLPLLPLLHFLTSEKAISF